MTSPIAFGGLKVMAIGGATGLQEPMTISNGIASAIVVALLPETWYSANRVTGPSLALARRAPDDQPVRWPLRRR